jgi:fructose-1,6-bisphosphatase/inositol monophosphatase family enzyme
MGTQSDTEMPTSDYDAWPMFCIELALEAGKLVREVRSRTLADLVSFKTDGSPVSKVEAEIEAMCERKLDDFRPTATFVGEESGGTLPVTGEAVAIDPIDGTWSLLNRTATCAVSLAVFQDGVPFCGVILNPATGELGYACTGTRTRLIQVSAFGEDDVAYDLPLDELKEGSILINFHPGKNAGSVSDQLFKNWASGNVKMVRMTGGSPAWALLEAAKGTSNYVNLWSRKPADAFDLAAGLLLLQGAGGQVTDLNGQLIEPVGHQGPFVAGVNSVAVSTVAAIVSGGLSGRQGKQ